MFMIGIKLVLSINYVYNWDKVGFKSTKMVVHISEMTGPSDKDYSVNIVS